MDPSALGRYLRESREAKELTLEDAVSALRIRRPILEAFEQGDFSLVDTPVQLRGLLRNYARYLELEEERVLQYYEAAMNPKRRRGRFGRRKKRDSELLAPRRITDTPPSLPAVPDSITQSRRERVPRNNNLLRNIFMTLGSIAALAIIIFVIVDTTQIGQSQTVEPEMLDEAMTEPREIAVATATFIPTSTPLVPTSETLDFAAQGFVGLSVRMEMTQRAWVRIVADDVEQLAEVLEPDEVVELDANNTVQITTANAIAVRLTVNGLAQPTFGRRGQQAEVNITTSGISITLEGEPSATPSPTLAPATETPMPTATAILLPTETATAVEVNTIGQTPATQPDVVSQPTEALPTPTSIFAEPASPMPDTVAATSATDSANTEIGAASVADTSMQAVIEEVETTATTIAPTEPAAILPLRATPANPTPTKSG